MLGNKVIFFLLIVLFIWLLNKIRVLINGRSFCLIVLLNSFIIFRRFKITKIVLFEKLEILIYNKIKINVILIFCEIVCSVFIFKYIFFCTFYF